MKYPSLLATNPYLADPAKRRRMFEDSVITSSAVEGVRLTRRELRQQTRADEARVASRPHKAKIAWFNSKPRNRGVKRGASRVFQDRPKDRCWPIAKEC